jgi:rhodanese-related sulfurtransferase
MFYMEKEIMALTPHELVVEAKGQIREVNTEQAQALLSRSVVVDVREPEEFMLGHLPGAINIPRGVLEFKIGTLPQAQTPATAAPLLLYCRSGGRSALAAVQLQRLGYSNVVSMAGGFDAWSAEGRPADRPAPVSFE